MNDLPKVIRDGVLETFNNLPCYVLDNGQRVFRLSNLTKALRGKEHGKFGNYLAASNISKYLPDRLVPTADRTPQGIMEFEFNGNVEKGYNSEDFMDVCKAFVMANINKESLSDAQIEIVANANSFLMASSKVGIIALIDEATGYQYERPINELQLKLSYFITEEARDWEKTFPDELWYEFGRLTNWKGSIKLRPKYWGKYVTALIYELLDADVSRYLKENKPPKYTGQKYFQWLNEGYGTKQLTQHIWQIIGMAKTCETMNELKQLAKEKYGKEIIID